METLLKTTKFNVVRRHIAGNDGKTHTREIVMHPGAAVMLAFLDADHILMVRNHRYTLDQRLLELPAGTLDEGEKPEQCAARELEEETGYRAGKLEQLCRLVPSPGILDEIITAFVATDLKRGEQHLDDTEDLQVKTVPFRQAIDWIRSGEIIDAKTIVTLLTYRLRQESAR